MLVFNAANIRDLKPNAIKNTDIPIGKWTSQSDNTSELHTE